MLYLGCIDLPRLLSLLMLFLSFHQSGLKCLKGSVRAMGTFSARSEGKIKVLNIIKFLQAMHKAVWKKIIIKRPHIVVLNEQKAGRAQELCVGFDIRSCICNIS